jgi:protein-S-isoprenylcysteine O-methyltransferase Ste14
MFPVLVWMYVRLAREEEQEVRTLVGEEYDQYAAATPGWFPRLSGPRTKAGSYDNERVSRT